MKKIVFVLLVFSASTALAQRNLTAVQYSIGFGSGDLSGFIEKASFRGFNIDYRHLVQPNVGVGFEVGWNVFYDERPADEVYSLGNLSYSGKQFRYQNQIPVLLAADYYFQPGEDVNPFVGFGVGTMYSKRETDMGVYAFTRDAWNFAIRPEIGILYRASSTVNFKLSTKYYYGFEAGDLPAQGYFTLNFGLVFTN